MKITVDHRERNSGVIKALVKEGVRVEEKQLVSADFVLHTKVNGEIKTIGIERKTQDDFINSIIDKRIINQLILLKENFDFTLLVIEGHENIYSLRNIHPNAIRGMLTSIAINLQVPIIYTNNYKDTASLLVVIAKRLEKPPKLIGLLKRKKPLTLKEQQELLIESLPGVGPTLARSLLKKFKTVKKIVGAKQDKLEKIEKIGPKKAKAIRDVFEKGYKD